MQSTSFLIEDPRSQLEVSDVGLVAIFDWVACDLRNQAVSTRGVGLVKQGLSNITIVELYSCYS